MRMMVKARIPTPEGNAAIADHSMGQKIHEVLDRMKPEACYFGLENGKRTMFAVWDLKSQSDMVPTLEPLFLQMNAEIEVSPVMTPEDLEAGFRALG